VEGLKQSKLDSALEALSNILIGAGVALVAQYVWFPMIGVQLSHGEHFATTAVFTGVSFARYYLLRRLFNGKSIYLIIRDKVIP
jgi:hypothetical protein